MPLVGTITPRGILLHRNDKFPFNQREKNPKGNKRVRILIQPMNLFPVDFILNIYTHKSRFEKNCDTLRPFGLYILPNHIFGFDDGAYHDFSFSLFFCRYDHLWFRGKKERFYGVGIVPFIDEWAVIICVDNDNDSNLESKQ